MTKLYEPITKGSKNELPRYKQTGYQLRIYYISAL